MLFHPTRNFRASKHLLICFGCHLLRPHKESKTESMRDSMLVKIFTYAYNRGKNITTLNRGYKGSHRKDFKKDNKAQKGKA
jgi:hypothetical protein